MLATGGVPFDSDSGRVLEDDLRRAELVSLPIALLVLLLVFGSVVAAGIPLGIGVLAVAAGLAADGLLARFTEVSPYATNVVGMIGLGVAIDYSLFVVSRFREELQGQGNAVPEALALTLSTAGRAVAFSGLTVAVGLMGLTFFEDLNFLGSIGWSGTLVVILAVFYGLTFLPALLAVLGPRVDALRVPVTYPVAQTGGFWHQLSGLVMSHPWRVLLPVVAALVLAGSPLLGLRLGVLGPDALPQQVESRRGLELLRDQFPAVGDSPVRVVVDYQGCSPVTREHPYETHEMALWLSELPGVTRVGQTGGDHAAVLSASTSYAPGSQEERDLVDRIRDGHPHAEDATVLVGGDAAFDLDTSRAIVSRAPLAAGFVMLATYVVLFLLLGSVLLPLKAVLTNLLSLSVSFGALVWIFQQGHLAGLLGFSPVDTDPALLVIVFCVVFGLSMDYEVLLLSRIKEQYEKTRDNTASVALGLQKTGRLVTGAALIMASVFFSFGLADTVFIKALGLTMGLAVILDATVVRALLVPATVRLLRRLNWWTPAALARLVRRGG